FGKSENAILNKFMEEKRLKWIPYDQFKNVKYHDKGGFGIIYKAIWLSDNRNIKVALKCLNNLNENNLNENLDELLNEWDCHEKCLESTLIINLHGFTKNPDTLNYMVVMDYANKGNLRSNLTKIIENYWNLRLFMLYKIIFGLKKIHEQNLIHCDLHDGNILNHEDEEYKKDKDKVFISDLGLCRTTNFLKEHDIYGVIPLMAPEVLRGKPYTPASDIYRERPEIIESTPQCYMDLMKKCWNEDPLKRPSADEVSNIIENWISYPYVGINEELGRNVMEFMNVPIGNNNLITESHPQACYTSRLLDFTSKKVNETLESECLDCILVDGKSNEK
ncbi:hypothetical protein RclHR1_09160001, partial [Rhizophagus clarus]